MSSDIQGCEKLFCLTSDLVLNVRDGEKLSDIRRLWQLGTSLVELTWNKHSAQMFKRVF